MLTLKKVVINNFKLNWKVEKSNNRYKEILFIVEGEITLDVVF